MASSLDRINTLGRRVAETFPVLIAPAGTVRETFITPAAACTITAIGVTCETQPVTAGTYTIAITDTTTGPNNLLVAATANLDATITADTYLALALTATVADLTLLASSVVSLVVVSNNGDLVGEGLVVRIGYDLAG